MPVASAGLHLAALHPARASIAWAGRVLVHGCMSSAWRRRPRPPIASCTAARPCCRAVTSAPEDYVRGGALPGATAKHTGLACTRARSSKTAGAAACRIIFTLPFVCLVFDVCAFGLDRRLFLTHVLRMATVMLQTNYGHNWSEVKAAMSARAASRVQWFTAWKAVVNTIMVLAGFKRPPKFKARLLRPSCHRLVMARHLLLCEAARRESTNTWA
jgi:hypothetical protein